MAENISKPLKHKLRKLREYFVESISKQNRTTASISIQTSENQREREYLEKSWRKKTLTYRETRIRIIVDFSSENMQARREWSELFKVLKIKPTNLEFYIQRNDSLKVKEKQRLSLSSSADLPCKNC